VLNQTEPEEKKKMAEEEKPETLEAVLKETVDLVT